MLYCALKMADDFADDSFSDSDEILDSYSGYYVHENEVGANGSDNDEGEMGIFQEGPISG